MFYLVSVTLSSNPIWSYSKAVASMTSIGQKGSSTKWLRWSFFQPYSRWILATKILKFCSSFRGNVWLHVSSTALILSHIIIGWVLYKYKAGMSISNMALRFKILKLEISSLKNTSGKNLKNILSKSRFYRDLQNLA